MSKKMETIYEQYVAPFSTEDTATIAKLDAESGTFWLHNGGGAAQGRAAIASTFEGFFRSWPQFGFDAKRVVFAPRHRVLDWAITTVLLGADGSRSVRIDAMDVIDLNDDDFVVRKNMLLDGAQLRAALTGGGS